MTAAPCQDPAVLDRFLAKAGWAGAERRPLAGDASTRAYQRLTGTTGQSLILMQAPDPATQLAPFVTVADLLRPLGLSVPRMLAVAADDGLLLLEDFGDATVSAALENGADPEPLYELAVDVLIALHRGFAPGPTAAALPRFDGDRFLSQARLFLDMMMPEADPAVCSAYDTAWKAVLAPALARPTLLLRDYHAGNLVHLAARPGVAACGLLDFQDAGIGPAAYDLVSLIEDARRDLEPALAAALVARYLAAFPELDRAAFRDGWAVLAALRHTRVIAVFQRLAGQGKPTYLRHLPRVWRYLETHLAHPALAPLARWFDRHLPAFKRAGPVVTEAQ